MGLSAGERLGPEAASSGGRLGSDTASPSSADSSSQRSKAACGCRPGEGLPGSGCLVLHLRRFCGGVAEIEIVLPGESHELCPACEAASGRRATAKWNHHCAQWLDSARMQPAWSAIPMTLACPYQSCSFCVCRLARTSETAWVGSTSCNSIMRKTNAASAGCPIGTKNCGIIKALTAQEQTWSTSS